MAAPSPAEVQYQLRHIHDDRSTQIISALGVCLGIAVITVLLRFAARHVTRAPLASDDWTIVAALLCAIGYVAAQLVCVSYGVGKHQILVTNPVGIARAISATIALTIASLSLTKVSVLLLYRRIFPNRGFRVIIWGVVIFIVVSAVARIISVIFKCNPIKAGFNPFIKAKCLNEDSALIAFTIIIAVTDLVVLVLPLPLVWKLHLPRIRKFQLTVVFLLGTFATVVGIFRATQVNNVSRSDLSYDSANRAIWFGVELCTAIVCANLLTLRPLFKYFFPGTLFSAAKTDSTSRGTASGIGKGFRQRWTRRHVASPSLEPRKDGGFHRLQHLGTSSTNDIEGQKYEGYLMSPVRSPVFSPRIPESAHF